MEKILEDGKGGYKPVLGLSDMPAATPMTWEAAPGGSVADRIEMIASLMDYDERAPVSVLNCPKWYAVEDCEQSIKSYQEYTGAGGEKDALKDPMDCDGYFVKDDCGYVAPQAMKIRRGGYY